MGKVVSFYITFDNPLAIYFSGQEVTGKVTLQLSDEFNHKGIFIRFLGLTAVQWTETEQYYDNTKNENQTVTVCRSDSHKYFEFEFPLLQPPVSGKGKLAAGLYEYQFHQVLPVSLPSSMEGLYGHTRYTCSAYISRPWRFNTKCKAAFTVLDWIDLNNLPSINKPINTSSSVSVGRLFWKSGSISANLSVSKQGFVPGETMQVSALVNNKSSAKIKQSNATLTSIITYRAGMHKQIERVNVAKVSRDGIMEPDRVIRWEDEKLLIPPVHPTRIVGQCNLITIEYFLKFKVVPKKILSKNLEISIPITIGSIPFVDDFPAFSSMHNLPANYFDIRPPAYDEYPDLPPPTYQEAMNGKVNIKDDDDDHTVGDLSFILRYPYYSSDPPPPYNPPS